MVDDSRRLATVHRDVVASAGERVRLGCPVAAVRRGEDGVVVQPVDGLAESFDHVVFASHADQTLRLLPDASGDESQILSCFTNQANDAVLHTDIRLLPRRRRAWASWNYHILPGRQQLASVTYDLSRLQNHDTPVPILLTLNETSSIEPSKVIRSFRYHHPAYSTASIAAQRRWDQISGRRRTHFCGAYWGYGFHEDGARSALRVARHFQLDLEACTAASTKESSRIAVAGL